MFPKFKTLNCLYWSIVNTVGFISYFNQVNKLSLHGLLIEIDILKNHDHLWYVPINFKPYTPAPAILASSSGGNVIFENDSL